MTRSGFGQVHISSIAATVVALSLVGYPFVAAMNAAIGLEGGAISIALRGVVLVLSLTVLVLTSARTRTRTESFQVSFVFLTIGLYGARLVSEIILHPEDLGEPSSTYLLFFFGVSLVPMASIMLSHHVNLDLALKVTFAIAAIATLVGLTVARQTIDVDRIGLDRGALEALNPISLGNLGTMLAVLAIWRLVAFKPERLVPTLLILALLATGLGLAVFAAARGPLVGFAVVVLSMLVGLRGRMRWRIALGAVVATAFLLLQRGMDDLLILRRFSDFLLNEDMSASIRVDLYYASLEAILRHPLFGTSIEVPGYRFYPHNLFLEYFMATGVVAGLLIVGLVLLVLYRGFGMLRAGEKHSWVFLLFLLSLSGALFSGAVYSNAALWITAALTLNVARDTRNYWHYNSAVYYKRKPI